MKYVSSNNKDVNFVIVNFVSNKSINFKQILLVSPLLILNG